MKPLDKLMWEDETIIPNRILRRNRAYIYTGCYFVYLGITTYWVKHHINTDEAWGMYRKCALIMFGVFVVLWLIEMWVRKNEVITNRGRNLTGGIWRNKDQWYEFKDIEKRAKLRKQNVAKMFQKKI